MSNIDLKQLIQAGAHFGHLTRRWNPKMKPYIFMERKGIHIIDLKKTIKAMETAAQAVSELTATGATVLFVGTKKQAKSIIASEGKRSGMNWVSERWLGGMLTNFQTIRKSIKRMQNIEKMETDGTFEKITKKEQLRLSREKDKLKKILEGVENMRKLPGALFIVDIKKEAIAVNEALRLNIPIFAIVDTNCDPDPINYVIPANDDAGSTIELITKYFADAVIEGAEKYKEIAAEQKAEEEREKKEKEEQKEPKKKGGKTRVRRVKFDAKGGKKVEKEEIVVKDEEKAGDKAEPAKSESKPAKEKKLEKSGEVKSEETKTEEVKETEEVKPEVKAEEPVKEEKQEKENTDATEEKASDETEKEKPEEEKSSEQSKTEEDNKE
jgi:small subunit ribosomal protein S2